MKKIISFALVLAVVLSFAIIPAQGYTYYREVKSGDYTYEQLDETTVVLKEYRGSAEQLIIPSTIDGFTVTEVRGMYWTESIKTLYIPDSVKKIHYMAFKSCKNLVSLKIGNGVTTIGEAAFKDCESLKKVVMGNSVTTIEKEAFLHCSALTAVTLSENLQTIEANAFSGCTNLKSLTVPKSVTDISPYAFGCTEVFYGYPGSRAQSYAKEEGITFVDLTKPASLSKTALSLIIGQSYPLKVNNGAASLWGSTNKKVAVVVNGRVTGLKAGIAYIQVKLTDGKLLKCKVTVRAIPTKAVTLNKTKLTMTVGNSFTLKATLNPRNATSKTVWATSNKNVAVVVNGKVTARSLGVAVIYAKNGGKVAKCVVHVNTVYYNTWGGTSLNLRSFAKNVSGYQKGKWDNFSGKAGTIKNGYAKTKAASVPLVGILRVGGRIYYIDIFSYSQTDLKNQTISTIKGRLKFPFSFTLANVRYYRDNNAPGGRCCCAVAYYAMNSFGAYKYDIFFGYYNNDRFYYLSSSR